MIYIPIKIPWILPYITHMVCCHMFPIYRERQESACMYSCMSIHYANTMILKPCICLEKKLLRPRLPTQDVAKDSVDTLAATLKGTDALIIATGFVPGNPFAMNAEAHAVDNLGTKALVDAAKMSGVNKIVPCIDESQRHDGLLNWGLTNIYFFTYCIYISYVFKHTHIVTENWKHWRLFWASNNLSKWGSEAATPRFLFRPSWPMAVAGVKRTVLASRSRGWILFSQVKISLYSLQSHEIFLTWSHLCQNYIVNRWKVCVRMSSCYMLYL